MRTPPMWQKVFPPPCWHFASSEGSPHENGYNSGTKSRKMLPKVAKRPKRRGLGPYSKKTKFLGRNFFWPFLAFFGHFLAVFGRNFMKERHLSKKSFLTFVHIVIDYTKPLGIVWNSKKKFLWPGLMLILSRWDWNRASSVCGMWNLKGILAYSQKMVFLEDWGFSSYCPIRSSPVWTWEGATSRPI